MEQGIFEVVLGKFLQVTGNLDLRKATAKSLNQPFAKHELSLRNNLIL
jgi:hypothetical protein